MQSSFSEVTQALSRERAYQEDKWGDNSESSVVEYLVYMEHHLNEAKRALSTDECVDVCDTVLSQVRKITALGVACMEQHGAVQRPGYSNNYLFNRDDLILSQEDGRVYQCVCADEAEAVFGLFTVGDGVTSVMYSDLFAISNFNDEDGHHSFKHEKLDRDEIIRGIRNATQDNYGKGITKLEEQANNVQRENNDS